MKNDIVSVADLLEERGRLKGVLEGERRFVLRLLRARFGVLPEPIIARVNAAESADLELWAERVLTAVALQDVFVS